MKQGWEIKKLGEVCTIQYGCAFDSSLFSNLPEEGMPLIRIRDIKVGYTSTYYKGTFLNDFVINRGDYLIGMDGEFNIEPWKSDKALLNQRVCKIEAKSNELLIRFVYRFMTKELKRIEDETSFVTVKHLSAKRLNQILIPIPPLAEQERIVAELDCLSGVIEKKKQQLKELDALAQSIFYEMFGDPIDNEKGWEVKSLGDICKFSQGIQIDVSLQSKENQEGWRKFLRIVDYTTSNTDIRYVKVSNEKYFVKLDDVVVVRYGASAGFVGTNKEGILANNLFKLNHERKIINHKFLFYLLSTDYYNRFVKDIAFGAAMPALSFASFSTFKIFLPPLSLQQEFASKIEAIDKQKELIKQSTKETETLFNSRMDYYFN